MPSDRFSEDLKIFMDEAEEILETLEETLMAMEREGPTPDLIQEVFRAAHTLKGSSATAGFAEMATVTHHLENVLSMAREGTFSVDSDSIDLLLETVDWLRLAKDALEHGNAAPDPQLMIMRLQNMENSRSHVEASKPVDKRRTVEGVSQIEAMVVPPEAADLPQRLVEVWFKSDAQMIAVRMFQVVLSLESVGFLCGSFPTLDEIENENMVHPLRVYLATNAADEDIVTQARSTEDVERVVVMAWNSDQTREQTPFIPVSNAPVFCAPEQTGERQFQTPPPKPLSQTVRVDVGLIDSLMNLVGELIIDRTRLSQLISDLSNSGRTDEVAGDLTSTAAHLYRITTEIQEGIMRARLMPLKNLLKKYPRMIRDLAARSGKEVEFSVQGEDTELDRSVIEALDDPLIHLLRNSLDHGLESPDERVRAGKPRMGQVSITATHQENHVVIVVSDDGNGIDPAKIRRSAIKKGVVTEEAAAHLNDEQTVDLIFTPGFSTAEKVNETSGRGVGLDVVRTNLKRINGALDITTAVGVGTSFILRLPLTLAIVKALLVTALDDTYAIPVSSVQEVVELDPSAVRTVNGREVLMVRDRTHPLIRLNRLFSRPSASGVPDSHYAVIVTSTTGNVAFGVEGLTGEQEVVVKSLGKMLNNITGISGATILGQGDVALILDVHALVASLDRARIA